MLVTTFSSRLCDSSPSHAHLRPFHALAPALTLAHVDKVAGCREAMAKGGAHKEKAARAYSDDGFVMGKSFLLQI